MLNNIKDSTPQDYNSYDFIFIVLFEIIMLSIIAFILKKRNWKLKDFNLNFSIKMIGVAVLLVIIRETIGLIVNATMPILENNTFKIPSISLQSNIIGIALITIVNSIYEEVLLIGYIFKRLEKYNPAIIVIVSSIIRASFHTYQGLSNLPTVFILALVFGIYYLKYKKLWPVILAHIIGNTFHFLNLEYHWFDK